MLDLNLIVTHLHRERDRIDLLIRVFEEHASGYKRRVVPAERIATVSTKPKVKRQAARKGNQVLKMGRD